jgi:hypothetical protein
MRIGIDMERKESCNNCYWCNIEWVNDNGTQPEHDGQISQAECRRHAPLLIKDNIHYNIMHPCLPTKWGENDKMIVDYWCGDFKLNEKEQN